MTTAIADTRARLIDNALKLFAAFGYDGVGVQQICEAVGVTKPTLYHHFGNKRALLETLLAGRLLELRATLPGPGGELSAALDAAARATFDFARAQPTLYRLYLTLWFARSQSEAYEVARRHHKRHFEAIDALFLAAERDEGEPTGRHHALAAAFLGMLNNHIGLALYAYASVNEALASRSVREFLPGALSVPEVGLDARPYQTVDKNLGDGDRPCPPGSNTRSSGTSIPSASSAPRSGRRARPRSCIG
ncbi:MAG: TetR/AcrR family transcriptional regulator [Roseiarcus sp.]